MAAARKLQQEIDKTLKKVQEGVDLFDHLWEQMHESEYQNQRDKFESELKKEIKRLQRYRDQIKTWIASSDVKDKKNLLEARRAVEREMERFKAAERETKTKAFSKEGLIKAQNLDPKSKARQEVRDWMNGTVDKLNNQIDELEAEIEAAGSSRKKQKNSRISQNEQIISLHKDHIQKLESLLRLLDNEQLEPEDFEDIRDFLDDYIERGQEDYEEFEDSVEYFYEGVAEQIEVQPALVTVSSMSKKDKEAEKKAKLEREREEKERQEALERAAEREKQNLLNKNKGQAAQALAQDKGRDAFGSSNSPNAKKKVATAAAAAAEGSGVAKQPASTAGEKASSGSSRISSYPLGGPQGESSVQVSRLVHAHGGGGDASGGLHGNRGNGLTAAAAAKHRHGGPAAATGWNYGTDIGGTGMGAAAAATAAAAAGGVPLASKVQGGDMGQQMPYQYQQDSSGGAAANQMRYGADQSSASVPPNLFVHNVHSIPQDQDRTWRTQARRGKTVSVPASYPTSQPLALRDPSIYERFDGETLFFAFYYQPGMYNQFLAARALKKKNWRFNKQHNAWFQRLKEPTYVTQSAEEGSYIWFDYIMFHEDGSRGWRPRVKENFVFEYSDLENDVKV